LTAQPIVVGFFFARLPARPGAMMPGLLRRRAIALAVAAALLPFLAVAADPAG